MKQMKHIVALLLAAMTLTACSSDNDSGGGNDTPATPDEAKPVELGGSGDVVVDKNNINGLALTLFWTDNGGAANTLQFANSSGFETPVEILAASGTTAMQFTAESLNTLAGRVGLKSNVASTLYIRLRSVPSGDAEPQYSNVYQILVTPFSIDATLGYVLDADKKDTGCTLASPNSDGIYSGFLSAATSWYNWWLREDNGTLWGNVGNDGGGKAFVISSNNENWNFWFPEPAGCYYTVVNTVSREWSALYIPSLTVSGDLSGEMAYDLKANKWTYAYEAAQAGAVNIRIAGTGRQYNVQTGTNDNAAVGTPVAFRMENGVPAFGSSPSDISVNVPAAGKMTLTLDLADPKEIHLSINSTK